MWKQPRRRAIAAAVIAVVALGAAAFAGVAQSQASGPPSNTSPPIVLSSFQQGRFLSVLNGRWQGDPASFSYQWQRCSPTGGLRAAPTSRALRPEISTDGAGRWRPRPRSGRGGEYRRLLRRRQVVGRWAGRGRARRRFLCAADRRPGSAQGGTCAERKSGPLDRRRGLRLAMAPLRPCGRELRDHQGCHVADLHARWGGRGSTLRLLVSATSAGPPVGGAHALSAPTRVVGQPGR